MGEERAKRGGMRALFQDRDTLRAVVDSVLEGRLGRATTDGEQPPRVARLEVGCYAILGGDAARPAARRLVSEIAAPRELVFPDAPAWRRLLHEVHPGLVDRSMQAFDAGALRVERISELAGAIAPGTGSVDWAPTSRPDWVRGWNRMRCRCSPIRRRLPRRAWVSVR